MKHDYATLTPPEALHVAIFIAERNARLYRVFAAVFSDSRTQEAQEITRFFLQMASEKSRRSSLLIRKYMDSFRNYACRLTDADVVQEIELPELPDGVLQHPHGFTLQDAVEVALSAEDNARQFYARLGEEAFRPDLRRLCRELATYGEDHHSRLQQQLARLREQLP